MSEQAPAYPGYAVERDVPTRQGEVPSLLCELEEAVDGLRLEWDRFFERVGSAFVARPGSLAVAPVPDTPEPASELGARVWRQLVAVRALRRAVGDARDGIEL